MSEFAWDPRKAGVNRRRHGVELSEATAVLEDDLALTIRDEIAAVDEPRYVTLGRGTLGRVLVVAYTRRGGSFRIVSARKATAAERRQYREKRA